MKRLFDIRKKNQIIDLSNSCIIKGENNSKFPINSETYLVTFSTLENSQKNHSFYMNYDELIEDEDINLLQEKLNISIEGDGGHFEILDYNQDFKIQFDSTESEFIDSEEVIAGCIIFKK